MGLHVHFKDGKFAVWDTVVDEYISRWTEDEDEILAVWMCEGLYSTIRTAKQQIEAAREHGCSAGPPARHERDEL